MTAEAKISLEQMKEKYRKEIEECREERDSELTRARTNRDTGRRKRRRRQNRAYEDMRGKRVAVPYSYFGVEGEGKWLGVVKTWRKYVGSDLKEYWGYLGHRHKRYNWVCYHTVMFASIYFALLLFLGSPKHSAASIIFFAALCCCTVPGKFLRVT